MSEIRALAASENNLYQGRVGLVYVRVSSKKQETEGYGLQGQEERCISFLKAKNVPYEKTYPDTFTGGGDFMNRPQMKQMLAYIDSQPHKKFLVVFDDLKRFARDTEFHIKLRAAFKVRDVSLFCLNYNFDESPEGKFAETIFAAQGELEREQNKRQVVQKMKARLESGYWAFRAKKGYVFQNDILSGKILAPDDSDSVILRSAMMSFIRRDLVRLIDVCHSLVESGFWNTTNAGNNIDKLKRIFSDPFYAGYIEYPRWGVKRTHGRHKGIISLEEFDQLQAILKKPSAQKRMRRDISPDFPLRGLIVCDHCDGHITAAVSKKRFPYYLCHNKACEYYGKSIKKEEIESKFEELLAKMTLKTELEKLVKLTFDRVWTDEVGKLKELQDINSRARLVLEKKASQLTEQVLNARSEDLRRIYELQLEDTAKKMLTEESEVESLDLSVPYRTALEYALKLLKNPYPVWKSMSVFEQHRLFYFIFEGKLLYNHNVGYRTSAKSFTLSIFEEFSMQNSLDVSLARIELTTFRTATGRSIH